jgi:hypothetical protein
MRIAIAFILLSALGLAACADTPQATRVASSTLPPNRSAECVDVTLLDDRCTRLWYECKAGEAANRSCVTAWEECCSLPGQGARSRIGGAQAVTHH